MPRLTLHQKRAGHLTYQENCWGCRVGTVAVASIPGGTRPGAQKAEWEKQFKADQEAYREARRAGEAPENSTVQGVRKTRMKQEIIERGMKKIEAVSE